MWLNRKPSSYPHIEMLDKLWSDTTNWDSSLALKMHPWYESCIDEVHEEACAHLLLEPWSENAHPCLKLPALRRHPCWTSLSSRMHSTTPPIFCSLPILGVSSDPNSPSAVHPSSSAPILISHNKSMIISVLIPALDFSPIIFAFNPWFPTHYPWLVIYC